MHAYICAVQLYALAAVVLVAGMAPEALHLSLVDGCGVVHLSEHFWVRYINLCCGSSLHILKHTSL